MPYKDAEKARAAALERSRRYRSRKHADKYGSDAGNMSGRHGNHARGSANGRWNGASRLVTSHGYIAIRVPPNHPHAWGPPRLKRFKYAYEHVVVMMNHIGRPLRDGEVVHHCNGNKTDNRIENLELMTNSNHWKYHASEKEGCEHETIEIPVTRGTGTMRRCIRCGRFAKS